MLKSGDQSLNAKLVAADQIIKGSNEHCRSQ